MAHSRHASAVIRCVNNQLPESSYLFVRRLEYLLTKDGFNFYGVPIAQKFFVILDGNIELDGNTVSFNLGVIHMEIYFHTCSHEKMDEVKTGLVVSLLLERIGTYYPVVDSTTVERVLLGC